MISGSFKKRRIFPLGHASCRQTKWPEVCQISCKPNGRQVVRAHWKRPSYLPGGSATNEYQISAFGLEHAKYLV